MSESLRTAYHEAGHALIACALKHRIVSVSLDRNGGRLRGEGLAPDATDEEIENALVVVFAGREAERYVPEIPAWRRHDDDDIWLGPDEMVLLDGEAEQAERRPSDEKLIAHYTERIGAEAIERARELAAELVERMAVIGRLERLADEILLRGHLLTGDEIEALLA